MKLTIISETVHHENKALWKLQKVWIYDGQCFNYIYLRTFIFC